LFVIPPPLLPMLLPLPAFLFVIRQRSGGICGCFRRCLIVLRHRKSKDCPADPALAVASLTPSQKPLIPNHLQHSSAKTPQKPHVKPKNHLNHD
jgi:hypothetical protein